MTRINEIKDTPPPIGPYSRVVKAGEFIFLSGVIGLNADGNLVEGGIKAETECVMEAIKTTLNSVGCDFSYVAKTSIYLSDMANFGTVNEIYASYFEGVYPARETIQVAALPKAASIEISIIAHCPH